MLVGGPVTRLDSTEHRSERGPSVQTPDSARVGWFQPVSTAAVWAILASASSASLMNAA